jgi:hypothetical protein
MGEVSRVQGLRNSLHISEVFVAMRSLPHAGGRKVVSAPTLPGGGGLP